VTFSEIKCQPCENLWFRNFMKDPIKLKTVFMGTSRFAATILGELFENNYNIISVYTRPDKKTGRDQKQEKSAVKIEAEKKNVKIYEPEKFDEETVATLKEQDPDLLIVADYGKILPESALKISGFGALNIHTSMLPKFRGPSPVQNALLEGETETGITIILMDENVDTGDILAQVKVVISPDEKYPELLDRMADTSADLLLETLPLWVERKITPRPQEEEKATVCQLIERSDGRIIWTDSAAAIYNRFRAFYPWPGIFTYWEKGGSNLRLKLLKISPAEGIPLAGRSIGEVFEAEEKIAVQTGEGPLVLEEIQLEGKSKSNARDFVNGYPDFIGSVLK